MAGWHRNATKWVRAALRDVKPEPPDSKISWAIFALMAACCGVAAGLLAPLGRGKGPFLVVVTFGLALALVVNLTRPKYEKASGRWKSFYEFLLRQMPPPD